MRNICQMKLATHKREKKIDRKREGVKGNEEKKALAAAADVEHQSVKCDVPIRVRKWN